MDSLPTDLDLELMIHLNLTDLTNLGQINHRYYNLCKSATFWRAKFIHDLKRVPASSNPKKEYIKYYITDRSRVLAKMKEYNIRRKLVMPDIILNAYVKYIFKRLKGSIVGDSIFRYSKDKVLLREIHSIQNDLYKAGFDSTSDYVLCQILREMINPRNFIVWG